MPAIDVQALAVNSLHPGPRGTMTLAACLAPRKPPTRFTPITRSKSDFWAFKMPSILVSNYAGIVIHYIRFSVHRDGAVTAVNEFNDFIFLGNVAVDVGAVLPKIISNGLA